MRQTNWKQTWAMGLLALATACSPIDWREEHPEQATDLGPVHFASGANTLTTKAYPASSTPYLMKGARFVCRKYYQADNTSGAYTKYNGTWLVVNDDRGNSVYRQADFRAPKEVDSYDFDVDAWRFYWQNRKDHIFLAMTDLHRAKQADYIGGTEEGSLKMDDAHPDFVLVENEKTYKANRYSLDTNKAGMTYEQQPDIIQAYTKANPSGSSHETNRVSLYFKHCFSCVHVNVSNSSEGSVKLNKENIMKVELLGVSKEAYVFYEVDEQGDYHKPMAAPVDLKDFSPAQLADNPYGTSMPLFETDEFSHGSLIAFHGLAFGVVDAIRVTWKEWDTGIVHVVTRKIAAEDQHLQSGKRYLYNLELRRGIMTILHPQILPWEIDETEHKEGGFLDDDQSDQNKTNQGGNEG